MEKQDLVKKGLSLPLVEKFYTLQGEGFHTGKAAYFIRIGGCDIGCRWCDSKVSWDSRIHPLIPVEEIVGEVLKTPARAVVVTGGEPSQYNLIPLLKALNANNIETFVETAGTNNISGEWDWICLSPKPNHHPNESMYKRANELKVIIFNEEDLAWAEECATKVNENCLLFLQPEWSRYKLNINTIVEYVKNNPQWRISLQSHKFMKIP